MSANERQVGGTHYKTTEGVPEHWDLAVMYDWDYFQGQIMKYVMRWKAKGETFEDRLKDLNKAKHFLEKYIEEAKIYDTRFRQPPPAPKGAATVQPPTAVELSPSTVWEQNTDFQCEGGYGNGVNIYRCLHCREHLNANSLQEASRVHACKARTPLAAQGPGEAGG